MWGAFVGADGGELELLVKVEPSEANDQPNERSRVHLHQVLVLEKEELVAFEESQRVLYTDTVERSLRVCHCFAIVEALVEVVRELVGGERLEQGGVAEEGRVAQLEPFNLGGHHGSKVDILLPVPTEGKHGPLRECAHDRVAHRDNKPEPLRVVSALSDAPHRARVAEVVGGEVHQREVEFRCGRPRGD